MKFIWAFDPQQDPKDAMNTIKEIKFWAHRFKAAVQPVCVLTESLLDLPDLKVNTKEYRTLTDKMVQRYLSQSAVKGFLPAKTLRIDSTSRRKKAVALAEYATENKCDLIFLNSHEKSANPFQLGGFAQALIEQTKTSLVVLNPQSSPSQDISKIFFPTDFERPSKDALETLVPWAHKLKASLTLFSRVEVTTFYLSGLSTVPPYADSLGLIEELARIKKTQAHKWKERLTKKGIPTTTIIAKERNSLPRDIVATAKKTNADIIALVNQRQPKSERFLGSTARAVLMRSHCPVLIMR